jgi:hypothetical protein
MIGAAYTMTLTPATATNTVGNPHTVTATVRDFAGRAVPGVTVRFSVTGANTASGSMATNASGVATFTYTGTVAGTDLIHAYADTNNNTTENAGEPFGNATKIWTAGAPATLTLTPATATNVVGTPHTVTATVKDAFMNPVPGVTVHFSVTGPTFPSPSSGSAPTNAMGQATFTFTASLPGTNAISAYADTSGNSMQDIGEPFGAATKVWTPPPSTAFCEVKITNGGWMTTNNGDRASFGGNAQVSNDGLAVQGQEVYQDHGPATPRSVKSIVLLATTCDTGANPKTATIYGRAKVNGSGDFIFRIDVTDGGTGGSTDSYGILMSDGYVSGQHVLNGGNVVIHKS